MITWVAHKEAILIVNYQSKGGLSVRNFLSTWLLKKQLVMFTCAGVGRSWEPVASGAPISERRRFFSGSSN